jgi:hypothetical protein
MASKKYLGKTCVYCTTATATTADHVFARQFFPANQRTNMVKVPACAACNRKKSDLEHYLTAVLPFAGRQASATVQLTDEVPRRLAKNPRLHRQLAAGRRRGWSQMKSGIIVPATVLPLDGEKLVEYVALVVRGLMWHHWQVLLGPNCFVKAQSLTQHGEKVFATMSGWNGRARVTVQHPSGIFSYHGLQGIDIPEISVWELTLLGGMTVSGGDDAPMQMNRFGIMTGPKKIDENAKRVVRAERFLQLALQGNARTLPGRWAS